DHDAAEGLLGEAHEALGAHAGRHGPEERTDELRDAGAHLPLAEAGPDQAHAAVDVEADAARRNHTVLGVEGRDTADRETVAPVAVRHAERRADYAGQAGDVRHLLEDAVIHLAEQRLGIVDAAGTPHPGLLGRRA